MRGDERPEQCVGHHPTSVPSSTTATDPANLYLPEPTGTQPVGTTSIYLKDTSRPDPWVAAVKARELMVSLWYPAKKPGARTAPYMTPKESELILKGEDIPGVPYDALSKTRTHAYTDARPAGRKGGLPLVVLSPGFTEPRSSLTGLAEDLASHGYVVAAIEHTYESLATTFPDGRVVTCVACDADKEEGFGQKMMNGRAADVSFVLDELTGKRPQAKAAALIDPDRIVMAGHSAGGASALAAMAKDSRIKGGIDMDGTTLAKLPEGGLARPFMFLGTQRMHSPGGKDVSWDRDWKLLTGWRRWLTVAGAEHASFADTGLLVEQLGLARNPDLSGDRAMEITRDCVRAFVDLHLKGKPFPELAPEVKVSA